MAFSAHNVQLNDGSRTMPDIPWLIADSPWLKAALRVVTLLYPDKIQEKSIIDLGCLEGGYTAEFARLGMRALGVEVRQNNFENCQHVADSLQLPSLGFVKDDVWNISKYGPHSVAFCCGLLYHLDRPAEFIRLMSEYATDAVIINTHFASEADGTPASATFKLSPLTENEGLPGRWYVEYDDEQNVRLEEAKWTSWSNAKSFWLTKAAILQTLQTAGFDMVFEQADFLGPDIRTSMETGYYVEQNRSMFVGIRTRVK